MLSLLLVACNTSTPVHITYMSQGNIVFVDEVESGKSFLPSERLTRENHIFVGWYLDDLLTYPMAFNAGASNDLILYAKWLTNDSNLNDNDFENWLTQNAEFINSLIDIESTGYSASDILHLVNVAQEAMITEANKSVVMIDIVSGPWQGSGGSGVIYRKEGNTYYVITNEHVTEDSSSASFRITVFNGTQSKMYSGVTKVHESSTKDLAILKFTTTDNLQVMPLADGNLIKKGQLVFAIGSPVWFEDIVTQGIVSYPKRNDADDDGFDADVIMHTAAINPGNSGGALINIYGELIGINAYSYPIYDEETDLQLYNFAIHIDEVKAYIINKN